MRGEFAVEGVVAEDVKIAVAELLVVLVVEFGEPAVALALSSVTARSSMALASAAVPNCWAAAPAKHYSKPWRASYPQHASGVWTKARTCRRSPQSDGGQAAHAPCVFLCTGPTKMLTLVLLLLFLISVLLSRGRFHEAL
jgi:hypothetical protein